MQPPFPPTPEINKHKTRLCILAVVHLVLAMGVIIEANMGIQSICTVICLVCASMSYNYCCLLIYIVYTLFDWISVVDPVGLYI